MGFPISPAEVEAATLRRLAEIQERCAHVHLDQAAGLRPVDPGELLAAELGDLAVHAALETRARQHRWATAMSALQAGATVAQVARATGLYEAEVRCELAGRAEWQYRAGHLGDADAAALRLFETGADSLADTRGEASEPRGGDPRRIRIGEPPGRVSSVELAHLQACNEDRLRSRYAPAGRVHSIAEAELMAGIEDRLRATAARMRERGLFHSCPTQHQAVEHSPGGDQRVR